MSGMNLLYKRVHQISRELLDANKLTDRFLEGKDSSIDTDGLSGSRHIYQLLHDQRSNLSIKCPDDGGAPLLPDHMESKVSGTAFGGQISYMHNESTASRSRPLKGLALITHISFVPIYAPKPREGMNSIVTPSSLLDYKISNDVMLKFNKIRQSAIHSGDSFAGGKDSITKQSSKFLYFNEGIITTLRSIERLQLYLSGKLREADLTAFNQVADKAKHHNDANSAAMLAAGSSSSLSMAREFDVRRSASASTSIEWIRHHSSYQTFTAIEQCRIKPDSAGLQQICNDDGLTAFSSPTIHAVLAQLRNPSEPIGAPLLEKYCAFDSFADEWADFLYGRYLQGSNYLILPVDLLFEERHLQRCSAAIAIDGRDRPAFDDDWRDLVKTMNGDEANPSAPKAELLRLAWTQGRLNQPLGRIVGTIILGLVAPLLSTSATDYENEEFVLFGAADGSAAVISRLQNMASEADGVNVFRMSESFVLDFGMNDFERGRLLKDLREFSTNRIISLASIGTFRFLSDALNQVQRNLSAAVSNWLEVRLAKEAVYRPSLPFAKIVPTRRVPAEVEGERIECNKRFIQDLESVTMDLSILNDLVDGGISGRAAAVRGSSARLEERLHGIGDWRVPGFMNLGEFIAKRYNKSMRNIETVGRRYDYLRLRIGELTNLVAANVQIDQNGEQANMLKKIDRLTLFGMTYYIGTVIAYIIGPAVIIASIAGEGVLAKMRAAGAPVTTSHMPSMAAILESVEPVTGLVKMLVYGVTFLAALILGRDVIALLREEYWQAHGRARKKAENQ